MAAQARTIYVGNVNASLDETTIRSLFQHCGNITEVRIAGEPSYNTRYCFVEFSTPYEAMTALSLNGLQLADREIRVSIAKQAQTPKSYPPLMSAGNPYHQYPDAAPAPLSKPRTKTTQDHEKILRTIHIDNIDFAITEFHLAQYFGVVGAVSAVRIAGSGVAKRKAWVEFRDVQSAQASFQLDNQVLGSHPIRITTSRSAIHTNGLTITPLMQQQMALAAQTAAQAEPSSLEPQHIPDDTLRDSKAGCEKVDLPIALKPLATCDSSPGRRSRSRSPISSVPGKSPEEVGETILEVQTS